MDKEYEVMLKELGYIGLEQKNGKVEFYIKQLEWQDRKRRGLLEDVKYKEIPYGRYYSVEVKL